MISKRMKYTEKELKEFRRLVQLGESLNQMNRIRSRMAMPKFIEDVGKEKCDEMFKVLQEEVKK